MRIPSLAALLSAPFGACGGCCVALAIVALAFPLWHGQISTSYLLLYLLSLVLGMLGALAASRRYRAGPAWPLASAVGLVVWFLVLVWATEVTLDSQFAWRMRRRQGLDAEGERFFWPLLLAVGGFAALWLSFALRRQRAPARSLTVAAPRAHDDRPAPMRVAAVVRRHMLAWLGLALVVWPCPLGPAPFPYDPHRVSFCIGPALYGYGHGLLPGVDLFSQYGLGQGFVFSFFLGETARQTVDHFYVLFLVVQAWFLIFAYHFLERVFRSRTWALALCLLAWLYQFYDVDVNPKFSVSPSVGIYRMPLLILVAWLFCWSCRVPNRSVRAVGLGMALGLSLFWSTDSGMACLAACLCALLAMVPLGRAAQLALIIVLVSAGAWLVLGVACYGGAALSLDYVVSAFVPWLWYVGGELGFETYPSGLDGSYGLTLAAFVLTLSISAGLVLRWHGRQPISFAGAALLFLGFVSLFLHAKYAARPIFAYWAGTALPALAVLAWALKKLAPVVCRAALARLRPADRTALWTNRLAGATCMLLWAWLATAAAPGGATVYALRSYRHYPSLVNVALGLADAAAAQSAGQLDDDSDFWTYAGACHTAADVELIQRNTAPGERTAVISSYDWVFLLEARRPPRYFILPVTMSFGAARDVIPGLTRAGRVLFVDRRSHNFLEAAYPAYGDSFYAAERSDNLVLYRAHSP